MTAIPDPGCDRCGHRASSHPLGPCMSRLDYAMGPSRKCPCGNYRPVEAA